MSDIEERPPEQSGQPETTAEEAGPHGAAEPGADSRAHHGPGDGVVGEMSAARPPAPTMPEATPASNAPAEQAPPPPPFGAGPTAPAPWAPPGSPMAPQYAAGQAVTWYWCPNCKLASSKPGICLGCRNPYVPAHPWGVPDQPYRPRVKGARSRVSVLVSALGALLMTGVVVGGLVLLASHGQPLGTAATGGQASTGNGGADQNSSFRVGSLKGTLKLPGVWATDSNVATPARDVAATVAPGAGSISVDVSVRKGQADVAIVNFPATDPATVLAQFQAPSSTVTSDAQGNKVTLAASRNLKIAGFTAVAQDYEVRTPAGALIAKGTFYAVNAGDHAVIIRAAAGPQQADKDLPAVESALVAIG